MIPRALQREWAAKLRASGFVDLESPGGELSDRGNLHPVAETREEHDRLASRMADGDAYTQWATSVLHDGPRFRSREERECWRLHAEGRSEADIATALTITRWKVRGHLAATRIRVSEVSEVKRWRDAKRQRTMQLRRYARKADPEVLMTLAALMLRPAGSGSRSAF